MKAATTVSAPSFESLLIKAVNEPGQLSQAFRAFHRFSFGNQLLAWAQCLERGIAFGPISTFVGWKNLGRHVLKGQKALSLCMPITIKREIEGQDEPATFTRFIYKPHWFVLAQTDGADVALEQLPTFDHVRAMQVLEIAAIEFDHVNGNVQGYARGRAVAINPVCEDVHVTRLHEMAHILLGHTEGGDRTKLDPKQRELEAEAVAYLCGSMLGLDGLARCRGYIQNWWGQGNPIPEESATKIVKVVDQILKAGALDASADADQAAA